MERREIFALIFWPISKSAGNRKNNQNKGDRMAEGNLKYIQFGLGPIGEKIVKYAAERNVDT